MKPQKVGEFFILFSLKLMTTGLSKLPWLCMYEIGGSVQKVLKRSAKEITGFV